VGYRRRPRAFTLIEAMIVVILVGILAVVATVAYRRWLQTAYLTEAQDMVGNIRSAEESFRAENGGYLGISAGLGPPHDYPASTPGQFKTAWGGPCADCPRLQWSALNVHSGAPLIFGYSVIAGDQTNPPSSIVITVNGSVVDLSAMYTAPWYIVEADGDTNGDGIFCHVWGMSGTSQLMIDNEGQ